MKMILIYVLLLVPLVQAEMNSSNLLMYLQNLYSRQPGLFLPGVTRKMHVQGGVRPPPSGARGGPPGPLPWLRLWLQM